MTDINNQSLNDEVIEALTTDELEAAKQSWLRERKKAEAVVKQCDDVLHKIDSKLNKLSHGGDND